ncbi:MAG: PAS domain S-box protein [Candidatus Moranbacteria bacterium]|nr:PAS domain S-box protein [Candidatus Moranbacteria bacterium]
MKLSFRNKAHLSIIATTGLAFLILYSFLWYFTEKSFHQLQITHANGELSSMERMLENETNHLAVKQSDWARWDDTYEFVSDRNDAYIISNMNDESFLSIGVNVMAFVNNAGELVYGKQVYSALPGESIIPEAFLKSFIGQSSLLEFESVDAAKQGILVTPDAMLLVAARPITTSDGNGAKRGVLFFGRYIDEEFVSTLSRLAGVKGDITSYGFAMSGNVQDVPDLSGSSSSLVDIREGKVLGWSVLDNIFGNPSVMLSIEYPADILEAGEQSFWNLAQILFFWMLAYLGVLLICVEFFTIRKVESIERVVSKVNELHLRGKPKSDLDDFSYLAKVMQGAIEKVEQSDSLTDVTWRELTKFRLALDQSSDHTVITDVEGKIIYANPAAEKMTGFSRTEMQGKTPALWGGQMSRAFYSEFWDTIRRQKLVFEGTVTNKRKDGTTYQAHLRVTPVLDNKKRVMNFIGTEFPVVKD